MINLENKSLREIFPAEPISESKLMDMQMRFYRITIYIRKQVCDVNNWNIPNYYRKARSAKELEVLTKNIFNQPPTDTEIENVRKIAIDTFKMYLKYFEELTPKE